MFAGPGGLIGTSSGNITGVVLFIAMLSLNVELVLFVVLSMLLLFELSL